MAMALRASQREPDDSELVDACPQCGKECWAFKCEHTPKPRNPVKMPRQVAAQLRNLWRIAHPPKRWTASPAGMTVWVEEDRVLVRVADQLTSNEEAATGHQDQWLSLTPEKWEELRDCVETFVSAASRELDQTNGDPS